MKSKRYDLSLRTKSTQMKSFWNHNQYRQGKICVWVVVLGSRGSLIWWKGEKIFIIIIVIIIILKRVPHKMLCAFVPLVGSRKNFSLRRFFFLLSPWRDCCQVNNKYNMQIKIIKRERVRKLEGDERRRKFIQITPMNISYSLSKLQKRQSIKSERENFYLI